MKALSRNNNAGGQPGKVDTAQHHRESNPTPPTVTGQRGLVLNLIRRLQPVKSLDISVGHAVPELAARVHDLRCMGFDIRTEIVHAVEFRGEIRRNVAVYSLGVPEWPAPGYLDSADGSGQLGLDFGGEVAQ